MSFSCGRVVQFFIVGPLHRKRSEGADDEERTTIEAQRERSELAKTPTKTLQPQCQPQAGARLPPTKTKTKTKNQNENPKRKPFSLSFWFSLVVRATTLPARAQPRAPARVLCRPPRGAPCSPPSPSGLRAARFPLRRA